MHEFIVATLRNEPRVKVDLLYDIDGWREISDGELVLKPCYILRSWSMDAGGTGKAKQINLLPEELEILRKAHLIEKSNT
jgi:hypothetical protein